MRVLLLLYLCCFAKNIFAQAEGDSIAFISSLDELVIKANRLSTFGNGIKVQEFSPVALQQNMSNNLADLLAQQSAIFIKSYGAGGLASPSFRGTGFGHTAIIWNGFNIQSPLNGGMDFSLLPLAIMDEVKIQHGGTSAMYGSGAVGGALHLNSKLEAEPHLSGIAGISIGSFQDYRQFGKLSFGGKRTASQLKISRVATKNNFTYINSSDVVKTNENAAVKNLDIAFDEKIYLGNKHELSAHVWYQNADRQIPPSSTSNNTSARQEDKSIRAALNWKTVKDKSVWQARIGFFDENIFYEDIFTDALNQSTTLMSEVELTTSHHLLGVANFVVHYEKHFAEIESASIISETQDRASIAAAVKKEIFSGFLQYSFNVRGDMIDGNLIKPNLSLSLTKSVNNKWQVMYRLSRDFRFPTLNDFFFMDAVARGNPDLLEEHSWGQEVNILLAEKKDGYTIKNELSVYQRYVSDWIQWLNNGSVWQPENFKRVNSTGIEYDVNISFKTKNINFQTSAGYQYTRSIVKETRTGFTEKTIDKQLPYVPEHGGRFGLNIQYKGFDISYRHNIVSPIFTNADNSFSLEGYQLGNIFLSKNFRFKENQFYLNIDLQNIWNKNYQVVRNFYMPRRSFRVEFQYKF